MSTFLNTARARTLRPGRWTAAAAPDDRPQGRGPRARGCRSPCGRHGAGRRSGRAAAAQHLAAARCVRGHRPSGPSANLTLQQQDLETEVAALEAPAADQRARPSGSAWSPDDSPAFLSLKTGEVIGVPRAGVRGKQPVIAMAGTGQPDSIGTTSTAHPAVDGRTDDPAHQRQARTAGVRGGGEPRERRGQVPKADRHDGKHGDTRAPPASTAPPRDTKNSSNNSHTG